MALLRKISKTSMIASMIRFSAAISAYGKGGTWAQASTLLQNMYEMGRHADMIGFKAAISARAKDEQTKQA